MEKPVITYKEAGVDIQQGNEAVLRIKKHVASTKTKSVLTQVGSFGAGFSLKEINQQYQSPVLVQSMDGVGTKMIVARMANDYRFLGHDLLSACANDIVVMGAKPLTILDYVASANLNVDIIERMISSLSEACREQDVALMGGEMAQMPDTYLRDEWDFVGIVTGVVEENKMITGESIRENDCVVAFLSNGLHTNGFSLARKLLFERNGFSVHDFHPVLQKKISDVLLAPHLNYTKPILDLLSHQIDIHGMAHITGGGIWDNIPRVLPAHLSVDIKRHSWEIPLIFQLLVQLGELDEYHAYHTWNMGLGLIAMMSEDNWRAVQIILKNHPQFKAMKIGTVVHGNKTVQLK